MMTMLACAHDLNLLGDQDASASREEDARTPRDAHAGEDAATEADADSDAGGGTEVAADVPPDVPCPADLGGECNLVYQCGCPVGERCVLGVDASGLPREFCRPRGTLEVDEPCGPGADDCAMGLQCFGEPEDGFRCLRFCYEAEDCPGGRACDVGLIEDRHGEYRICGDAPP
jgi:hypothetical protein